MKASGQIKSVATLTVIEFTNGAATTIVTGVAGSLPFDVCRWMEAKWRKEVQEADRPAFGERLQ